MVNSALIWSLYSFHGHSSRPRKDIDGASRPVGDRERSLSLTLDSSAWGAPPNVSVRAKVYLTLLVCGVLPRRRVMVCLEAVQ